MHGYVAGRVFSGNGVGTTRVRHGSVSISCYGIELQIRLKELEERHGDVGAGKVTLMSVLERSRSFLVKVYLLLILSP